MKLKQIQSILLALLIVTLAALLAACSPEAGEAGDPLEGSAWVLFAYRKTKPIEGTQITIQFNEGQAVGSAGCNSYGGAYEVDGSRITFNEIASTVMFCNDPEGAMDQESFYLEFLNQAENFELSDGRLVITRSDGETLTFDSLE